MFSLNGLRTYNTITFIALLPANRKRRSLFTIAVCSIATLRCYTLSSELCNKRNYSSLVWFNAHADWRNLITARQVFDGRLLRYRNRSRPWGVVYVFICGLKVGKGTFLLQQSISCLLGWKLSSRGYTSIWGLKITITINFSRESHASGNKLIYILLISEL